MKTFNVAVVGATGAVGKELIQTLETRQFPIDELYPLASSRSVGKTILFKGSSINIEDLSTFDFSKIDIALFSAGSSISEQHAPRAAAAGCIVIDNSSHFRYQADIALVIPEVNPHAIANYKPRNIIANPNCSTIQMLVALKPLYDYAGISKINIATYQAVSGAGNSAIAELAKQSIDRLSGNAIESNCFTAPIAFNVIPHIDTFQENGYTKEEMKMVWETHKIMGDDTIRVNPTAVRVPVFFGHSEAIHIETKKPLTADDARELLANAAGICVIDELVDGGYPTASEHAAGNDQVFVGRIRQELGTTNGLNLWVVSDNIRKGAALNAIQIAEMLVVNF